MAAEPTTTSTGHAVAAGAYLNRHFAAAQPEYEAIVRAVGFERGWQILDAGCGSGSFLPLLAALVGPDGGIHALDTAPENIAAVQARLAVHPLPCPVEPQLGTVTALPYPDAAFDAVWCANVSQYLTDTELSTMLAEFRRVVRPGGIVALKEQDGTLTLPAPLDPALLWHLHEAARSKLVQARGWLRAHTLADWLIRAGLADVRRRTTLVERSAPLRPVERAYIGDVCAFLAQVAETVGVAPAELAVWRSLRDRESLESIISAPTFCWREGHVVTVGRVPHGLTS
jgi:arsenite methyltransferase